jgi:hypothetical protein
MSLGVLGAASGSAGLILEHYWSFLTSLFSFAEEALAFGCLPNFWTLLCSHKRLQFSFNRYLNSLIFCRRVCIFLGLFMHVSTHSLFAKSTVFHIWVVNAENGDILLLSQISISSCCWSLNCLTVERGVCEQPQVEFPSFIVDDHILHITPSCMFLKFLLCNNFCI